MGDRALFRLRDIVEAIDQIGLLMAGATFDDLLANRMQRAAF